LGPVVVLHWDGRAWTRIVSYGFGTITPSGAAGDGHGGLWWMTPSPYPALLHWTGGKLIQVTLPAPTGEVDLYSLARTSLRARCCSAASSAPAITAPRSSSPRHN
jgi:hypothetical protein